MREMEVSRLLPIPRGGYFEIDSFRLSPRCFMGNGRRHYATTENPDIRDLRSVQRVGLRRTSQAEQFKRCVPVSGPRATPCIYAGMKDGPSPSHSDQLKLYHETHSVWNPWSPVICIGVSMTNPPMAGSG